MSHSCRRCEHVPNKASHSLHFYRLSLNSTPNDSLQVFIESGFSQFSAADEKKKVFIGVGFM